MIRFSVWCVKRISASVNGTVRDVMGANNDIADIVDVLSLGQEKRGSFNVQGLNVVDETDESWVQDAELSTKYISKYSYRVGFSLRFETSPTDRTPDDFEDSIFPAILVYDSDGLYATGEDRFSATFREGHDPKEVLLGAYVLSKCD